MYVSNLDTPLGYHIAQFFREDHLTVNPSIQIVGSSTSPLLITGVASQIDVIIVWSSSINAHK